VNEGNANFYSNADFGIAPRQFLNKALLTVIASKENGLQLFYLAILFQGMISVWGSYLKDGL
jgi:hypothetical protein